MSDPDDDFEDFLNRRKPVFRRPEDETFEPPEELDRVVLRQAREAIKPPEPMRMFSAPRWSMPIALAATLVLAFTVIFHAGMPQPKSAPKPEVTVQTVAERVDAPSAAAPPKPRQHRGRRSRATGTGSPTGQREREGDEAGASRRGNPRPSRWPPPLPPKPPRRLPGAAIRNPGRRKSSDCAMRVTMLVLTPNPRNSNASNAPMR